MTVSLVAAKEISGDVAVAAVSSDFGGIFTMKEVQKGISTVDSMFSLSLFTPECLWQEFSQPLLHIVPRHKGVT